MLGDILNLLFPNKCYRCKKPGQIICQKCTVDVRIAKNIELPNTFAVFDYGDKTVRKAVRDLKYYRRSELSKTLVIASVPYITEYISSKLQSISSETLVIVPIPEHHNKRNLKGFNQSDKIAKWLSKELDNFVVKNILIKNIETLPQAKMKRSQRLKNLINTMETESFVDPKVTYVVIDDVTTTGATFTEARRALRAAGARKILCIALSHGYAKSN